MDDSVIAAISGLLILTGLLGIFIPGLPGIFLSWAGVALWAFATNDGPHTAVFTIATVIALVGTIVKYTVPGQRMRNAGVPWTTMLAGGMLGIVGFFVIPVVGIFPGFVLGIYLVERVRLDSHAQAWPSTATALKAVGLSILIELLTGLGILGTWIVGVI